MGYATTFRLFMQMMGINCMVVHDSYLTHSWDLVQLDGEWYHTDCTFDSPSGNFRHFNLNDEARLQDEDWNADFFPAATGTKYNYAMMNRETLKDIYDLPAWLKAGIDEGKTVLSCGFEDDVEDEAAAEYMLSRLSEAVMSGRRTTTANTSFASISSITGKTAGTTLPTASRKRSTKPWKRSSAKWTNGKTKNGMPTTCGKPRKK